MEGGSAWGHTLFDLIRRLADRAKHPTKPPCLTHSNNLHDWRQAFRFEL